MPNRCFKYFANVTGAASFRSAGMVNLHPAMQSVSRWMMSDT